MKIVCNDGDATVTLEKSNDGHFFVTLVTPDSIAGHATPDLLSASRWFLRVIAGEMAAYADSLKEVSEIESLVKAE